MQHIRSGWAHVFSPHLNVVCILLKYRLTVCVSSYVASDLVRVRVCTTLIISWTRKWHFIGRGKGVCVSMYPSNMCASRTEVQSKQITECGCLVYCRALKRKHFFFHRNGISKWSVGWQGDQRTSTKPEVNDQACFCFRNILYLWLHVC